MALGQRRLPARWDDHAVLAGDHHRGRDVDLADPLAGVEAAEGRPGLEHGLPRRCGCSSPHGPRLDGLGRRSRRPMRSAGPGARRIGSGVSRAVRASPAQRGEDSPARRGRAANVRAVAHSTSPLDQVGVAPPQQLGDRPAHRVADGDARGRCRARRPAAAASSAQSREPEAAPAADAPPVAPVVEGHAPGTDAPSGA